MDLLRIAARVTAAPSAIPGGGGDAMAKLLNNSTALDDDTADAVQGAFIGWSEYGSPPESPEHVEQFVQAVRDRLLKWESSLSRHPDTE